MGCEIIDYNCLQLLGRVGLRERRERKDLFHDIT